MKSCVKKTRARANQAISEASSGTWTQSGLTPLVAGQVVTATAAASGGPAQSFPSAGVTVDAAPPLVTVTPPAAVTPPAKKCKKPKKLNKRTGKCVKRKKKK
jgi:hypothetical protein